LRAVAAALLIGTGMLLGLWNQTLLPPAEAVIERASQAAEAERDRRYRVSILALGPEAHETVGTGTLHLRGSRRSAIEYDAKFGKGWSGTDGTTGWTLPAGGLPRQWPAQQGPRSPDAERLDFALISTYLRQLKDSYDFQTVSDRDGLLHVRAVRKPSVVGPPIGLMDFWVRERDGVIQKLQARADPNLTRWSPWLITIEFVAEEPRPDAFYTMEAHQDGK
jgi:hypothetical protein